MSTEALYVRLPTATKQLLDQRAVTHGLTIAKTAAALIDDGLHYGPQRFEALEQDLRHAQELASSLVGKLAAAEQTLATHQQLRSTISSRLSTQVGSCPACHETVTGSDVFIEGHCPAGHELQTAVLRPSPNRPGLEANALTGALVVVGIALSVLAMTSHT